MKKLLISLVATFLFAITVAYATPQMQQNQQNEMSFQIIKEQLQFTKESFKAVALVNLSNGKYAVQVELTPEAAKQLHALTETNINHDANLVWQKHILSMATIRSPLGAKFQIIGLDKQQAETFVNEMHS